MKDELLTLNLQLSTNQPSTFNLQQINFQPSALNFQPMKTFFLSATFFWALAVPTLAQSPSQKAFTDSYTYEYAGNVGKAIETLKAVHQNTSYETSLRLGWLYYSAKNYTESVKYYKMATDLMKMSVEARLGYVMPLSALAKWDEVIVVYKEILAIEKYHSSVNYSLASIYYYRKDYTLAKQYIDNAHNVYPFDYDIVILTAWTYQMLGKREIARTLFEKALLIRPNDASALEGLKN
ncbi:MAG: hypothetical protein EAZ95_05540 [Bacteroidetes bacterium]|nr:MAG: hypothetical protein EAZ95_05540 [Bacteroidota bacterium]